MEQRMVAVPPYVFKKKDITMETLLRVTGRSLTVLSRRVNIIPSPHQMSHPRLHK